MSTNLDLDDVVAGNPEAARELAELRAENASLKEVISLSEDSRLMDEYLKLERACARQAERIAELEAQLVIEKGQLDLRDEENRILFAKSEAQAAVIERAKTAMDSAKETEGWDEVPYRLHVKLDALFDAINALPEGAEKHDVPGIDDPLGEMGVAFRMFVDAVIKPAFVTLTRREQALAESTWRCSWESRSLLAEKKASE